MNFTDGHSSSSPETKHNPPPSTSTRVQVAARFRPVNKTEAGLPDAPVCEFGLYNSSVLVDDPTRNQSFHFSFDHILNTDTTQNGCYRTVASPLVDTVLSGINAAIIAYGQTGSGKTHTMFGPGFDLHDHKRGAAWNCPIEEYGIIPRLFEDIFARSSMQANRYQVDLEVGFVQIYNEKVTDLITTLPLKVRQNVVAGSFEANALFSPIDSVHDLLVLVREGLSNRVTARTQANVESSRSHAILTTKIYMKDLDTGELKISTLHLVDLAGSEKVSKTGATGTRLKEAGNINRSLHALSKVIESLSASDQRRSAARLLTERFVPYRESTLTKLLKNTLGGNSKTVLLLCASAHAYNISETISTCEFGSRAKNIRNRPVQNVELTADNLRAAISQSMDVVAGQNISLRRLTRQVALHRVLVQQVLSRIPPDANILKDIFRALPLLSSLPQVFKWGDIYIPVFLLQMVFEYSGLVGVLKGVIVSKEWYSLLTTGEGWDHNVWRTCYLAEKSLVDDKNTANKTVEHSSTESAAVAEKKNGGVVKGRWRNEASTWYLAKEKNRLEEIRKRFREKESKTMGRAVDLVLLN